jgi:hypothetical protein
MSPLIYGYGVVYSSAMIGSGFLFGATHFGFVPGTRTLPLIVASIALYYAAYVVLATMVVRKKSGYKVIGPLLVILVLLNVIFVAPLVQY